MIERLLRPDSGYHPERQKLLGMWAAQLDDQLRILRRVVEGLEPAQLEWQPRPGTNSIGMLLAHLAIVEVDWLQAVAAGEEAREADVVREVLGIGIDDDGMPAESEGGHPEALAGWPLERYLALLERAREATHATLRGWDDADLEQVYEVEDGSMRLSRAWIVYHVLEHLSCHLGQIRVLRRQLRARSRHRSGRGR